jgi:hypothetical protein
MKFQALPQSDHALIELRPIVAADVPLWFSYLSERSARVLARCGFEREGLLRSYRMVRGVPGDFWIYWHVVPIEASPPSSASESE